MRVAVWQGPCLAGFLGSWLQAACGAPTSDGATGLRLRIHTTPPPDDVDLSPLRETGVIGLELRDAQTNQLLASGGANLAQTMPDQAMPQALPDLNLGLVEPFGLRDL